MKLFVFSDVHSYYSIFKKALDKSGFDETNPDHLLICLGDTFDRGDESVEMLEFLERMIEKNKIILVKGNHSKLAKDLCARGWPMSHDYSNGTVKTIWDLGGGVENFRVACDTARAKLEKIWNKEVNFFETEHYIFVHGWIASGDNWREASDLEWGQDATWKCGPEKAAYGCNRTGKIIVFGHWHVSYMWNLKDPNKYAEWPDEGKVNWKPCRLGGCIGIDACTAYSKKVNILVLEDSCKEDSQMEDNFS